MIILGINAYHADAAAAIISDGLLIAAAEEERFNRIKHSTGFPKGAISYCLKEAGISVKKIDYIAVPRNSKARLLRKLYYGLKIPALAARRFTAMRKAQSIKEDIAGILALNEKEIKAKVINIEHHRAHIASSFFVSPFDRAMLFSADGLGDFASTMWGIGEGSKIRILGDIPFPHSLGLYYTAITQYLGFLNYGDEYKVMGLAAYGEPRYQDEFKKIIFNHGKSGFKLGLDYFLHHKELVDMRFEEGYPDLGILFSPYLEKRLGPRRKKDDPLGQIHKDIAATLQARLEEVLLELLNDLAKTTGEANLCLSGGVAFNCVANGKILKSASFENIYIPPAPGDAGLAIGAAFYLWNQLAGGKRDFVMEHAYWGPKYGNEIIDNELITRKDELDAQGCRITKIEDKQELCRITACEIAKGKVIGWFQEKMEWGPRALGNRSILVDPRRQEMKNVLNMRIKHREPFRPFAPSILQEQTGEYFEKDYPSPFMLFTYKVRPEKRDKLAASTHVDGTGRVQTVSKKENPLFWQLIKEFGEITGIPVLLNTSFNENEPIVNTPKEALDCFLKTRMDVLVIEDYFINRK